jgi:hypothetical protein
MCVADGCLTLYGQPAAYWSNGYATVREGNPLAAWVLGLHPAAFVASGVPYLILVVGAVVLLPRRWAAAVAVAVALAHAAGVAAWLLVLCRQPVPPLAGALTGGVLLAALAWQKGWRASTD